MEGDVAICETELPAARIAESMFNKAEFHIGGC